MHACMFAISKNFSSTLSFMNTSDHPVSRNAVDSAGTVLRTFCFSATTAVGRMPSAWADGY
eukprot:scaffold111090_cov39-Prasinocladus_malaysianus.AAC.1